jgi:hypothetical protein
MDRGMASKRRNRHASGRFEHLHDGGGVAALDAAAATGYT